MEKIGVPQPEQIIKSSSNDIISKLAEVNQKVLPLFKDAAEALLAKNNGDATLSLC